MRKDKMFVSIVVKYLFPNICSHIYVKKIHENGKLMTKKIEYLFSKRSGFCLCLVNKFKKIHMEYTHHKSKKCLLKGMNSNLSNNRGFKQLSLGI